MKWNTVSHFSLLNHSLLKHLLSSDFSTSQKILFTMRDLQYGGQSQCESLTLWDAEREKLAATKSLQAEETWEAWCSKFRCNSVTVTPHYSGVTVVTVLQCYSNTSLEKRRAAWEGREINQKSLTGDSSESHTAPISFFQGFVILTCLELYKVVLVSFVI